MNDFSWVLTTEVEVRECDPGVDADVVVTEVGGGNRTVKISTGDADHGNAGDLLFNGRFVNVGDDFFCYLGMVDEVLDSPTGAVLFKTDNTSVVIPRRA